MVVGEVQQVLELCELLQYPLELRGITAVYAGRGAKPERQPRVDVAHAIDEEP